VEGKEKDRSLQIERARERLDGRERERLRTSK